MANRFRQPRGSHAWSAPAWLSGVIFFLSLSGCGGAPASAPLAVQPQQKPAEPAPTEPTRTKPKRPKRQPTADRPLVDPGSPLAQSLSNEPAAPTFGKEKPVPEAPTRPIDEEQLRERGIRQLPGKFITIFTDLPSDPEIDELPAVFDQAVPQWQKYFGIDEDTGWRVAAYLAKDKQNFWACGLWDDDLPEFPSGFTRGREFWMLEQPNGYYTRHLMLHEGTHAFMFAQVSDTAPPWYNEGLAEFFGTHRWVDDKLTTGYFPVNRDEVPLWGRIKIVRDAYAARQGLPLPKVMAMGPRAHLINESYGWSWGAGAFLDGHPRYRDRFRAMYKQARQDNFNQLLQDAYGEDWSDLQEEWQVFVANIDYGYDFERMAIDFQPGEPLPKAGKTATISADRGWQSSGFRLEKNKAYKLTAKGRYQLAQEPAVWWSEPNGVSIRYFGGWPLGMVQAAVRPDVVDPTVTSALLQYDNVGLTTDLLPTYDGTLYLRINDSPAELADNAGTVSVTVREVKRGEK